MKFEIGVLLVSCFSLTFGQLVTDGFTRPIEKSFRRGLNDVVFKTQNPESDIAFFQALESSTKDLEVNVLVSTVNEALTNFALELAEVGNSDKDSQTLKEKADALLNIFSEEHFVRLFKESHLSPELSTKRLAEVVSGKLLGQDESKLSKDFLRGLNDMDAESLRVLLNAAFPTQGDGHQRSKRYIQWACRLVQLMAGTGMGQGQLEQFIHDRIPQRWQGTMSRALAQRGAKGLLRLASLLCGSSSLGGGSSTSLVADASIKSPTSLIHVYEAHFLNSAVDYEVFHDFAQWYAAAVNSGLRTSSPDLKALKDQLKEGLFDA